MSADIKPRLIINPWHPGSIRPTSPEAAGEPRRTLVDAALALDEIAQRLIQVFVFRGVPQHPRPFAPCPVIKSLPRSAVRRLL